MALVNRSFSVNVTPGMMPPIVHVSEYDVGRAYTVSILDEQGNTFTIPSGTTVSIEGTLNGSVGFTQTATVNSNNTVSFTLSESMTAYAGKAWCKIKLTLNNQPIQTCAFILAVDRAGVEAETVIGAPGFEEQIAKAAEAWLENQGFASPTIGVTEITGGHRVTVTDYEGSESFDVMDGEDGFQLPRNGRDGQVLLSDGQNGAKWGSAANEPILSILMLYGDEQEIQTNWQNSSKAKMNFRYVFYNVAKNKQKNGWCKLSLQGNATLSYPKHNFNIQFYKDAGLKTKDKVDYMDLTEDKHPKWTIKANYNDYSQGRNVVSARLWGDVVHCRKNMSAALSDAPNHGAIDGHPCLLYMNGNYYGLYMFNMSKSDWMIGIDEDNPAHCAVSSDIATDDTKWLHRGLNGWGLEIPDEWQTVTNEDQTTTSVQAGFLALQDFVINSTDAEFYAGLKNYLDVASAIDYLIFSFCVCNADSMNKNQFLVTWDAGKTWAFTAYDMDQTFGAAFTNTVPYTHDLFSTHPNHLFERIISNFYAEILERYAVLRGSVFSYEYMARELELFFKEFPAGARETDLERWPGIMFQSISTLDAMKTFIQNRLGWCDSYFAAIDPSYVPCTGVSITDSTVSFSLPGTYQLTATKTPVNTSDSVIWTSSNPAVATVSENGLVTAVANGSAVITATCGNYSDTCTVAVAFVTRGEIDYTNDGIGNATWSVGGSYNKDTGAFVEIANEHYTNKFHLQNCLYRLSGAKFGNVFVWDENGNYAGCIGEQSAVFSARSDYFYAVKSYNEHSNVSLMPINNSATAGANRIVTIDTVNGLSMQSNNSFFYCNTVSSKFSGLVTSISGTIDYSAVDWVYSDNLVLFEFSMSSRYQGTGTFVVALKGSGSNVEVWLYTKKYTTVDDMNAYLAEHPITLVFNM